MDAIGERTIWIDCDVIQADGGTRCASICGSFVALSLAIEYLKKQGVLNSIAIRNFVAAISVGIIDGETCLDLNYEEDSRADVDMNIVMTDSGKFVEVQGTAEKAPFDHDQMNELFVLGKKGIENIIDKQKEALKGVIG